MTIEVGRETSRRGKLSYSTPRLSEFGTLREVTLNVGSMMMLDGGTIAGMRRTAT